MCDPALKQSGSRVLFVDDTLAELCDPEISGCEGVYRFLFVRGLTL